MICSLMEFGENSFFNIADLQMGELSDLHKGSGSNGGHEFKQAISSTLWPLSSLLRSHSQHNLSHNVLETVQPF